VLHAFSLILAPSVLWLLLSRRFAEPLPLGLGLLPAIAMALIIHRVALLEHEGHLALLGRPGRRPSAAPECGRHVVQP